MKKWIALALAVLLVFSLAACNQAPETPNNPSENGNTPTNNSNNNPDNNNPDNNNAGEDYKVAADALVATQCLGAVDKLERLAPPAYFQFQETSYGVTKASIIEAASYAVGAYHENMKNSYGENFNLTTTLSDPTDVPAATLSAAAAFLEMANGVKASTVTAGCSFSIYVYVDGEIYLEIPTTALKIGDKWYCTNLQEWDGQVYVTFCIEEFLGG